MVEELVRGPEAWCLGTMTWGAQTTLEEAHKQLELAIARGVRRVDTSELYPLPCRAETHGQAEGILGAWIAVHPERRGEVEVSTKVAGFMRSSVLPVGRRPELHYRAGNAGPGAKNEPCRQHEADILAACEASLARLCTSYIDVLYLHWPDRYVPMFGSRQYNLGRVRQEAVAFAEIVGAMGKLLASGKIRAWGLSNETAFGVCELCHECDRQGVARPAVIQNSLSLLDRAFETDSLAEACAPHHYALPLVAFSPLAGGALTGKYAIDAAAPPEGSRLARMPKFGTQFNNERVRAAVRAYEGVARARGWALRSMALAWALSRPCVGGVLFGASSAAQLEDNLDALAQVCGQPFPAALSRAIDAVYLENKDPANFLCTKKGETAAAAALAATTLRRRLGAPGSGAPGHVHRLSLQLELDRPGLGALGLLQGLDARDVVVEDLLDNVLEGVVDGVALESGRLHKVQAVLFREGPALVDGYGARVLHVALVAHEHELDLAVGVALHLAQPALEVLERLSVRDIVHQQRADRAAVVRLGDRAVPLLAGGVPDLRFHGAPLDLDLLGRKLDADRVLGVIRELVAPAAPSARCPPHRCPALT